MYKKSIKILVPAGALGIPFDDEALINGIKQKPDLIAKQKDEIKKTLETLTSPSSSSEEASNIILSYIS